MPLMLMYVYPLYMYMYILQEEQASLRMHTDIAGDIMVTAKDEAFLNCLETEQVCLLHIFHT